MKKLTVIILCITLISASLIPVSAAEVSRSGSEVVSQTVDVLDGGITVVDTITLPNSNQRSNTRSATLYREVYRDDVLIAQIDVTGTFQYNGTSVSVVSKHISKCETYNGWSFKQSSFISSAGSIVLTGKLTKPLYSSAEVRISLSCDPYGNIY